MRVSVLISAVFVCIRFSVCAASNLNDERVGQRTRRMANSNCEELVTRNLSCIENVAWNLEVMLKSLSCKSKNSSKTLESLCIEKKICGGNCSLESIDEKSTCDTKPTLWKKLVLLKLLCAHKIEGMSCARILFNAYAGAASTRLKQLNTTSGRCCIASLMTVYNSSGNVTELLPLSWKNAGLPIPKECIAEALPHSTAVPHSTVISSSHGVTATKIASPSIPSQPTSKITTRSQMPVEKNPSDKMTSRLKASLVIASIIFFVVAVIVGRYCYHRVQRKRRAKYEDYGYSQLKIILEDNLYEDEEDDDDPLLSAT